MPKSPPDLHSRFLPGLDQAAANGSRCWSADALLRALQASFLQLTLLLQASCTVPALAAETSATAPAIMAVAEENGGSSPPDSPAAAATAEAIASGPEPRSLMIRSAVLPGWGQLCNGRPLKALMFGSAAAIALGSAISAISEIRALDRASTPQQHQDRLANRNTRLLLLAATMTFAAVDAFVDAHLADLEVGPAIAFGPGEASLEIWLSQRR